MVSVGPCLCSKLKAKRYDEINHAEITILRQAWNEAPQLFQPSPSTRRTRASRSASLAATYSTNSVALDSVSQFDFRPEENVYVRIYHIIQKADRLQRICAYAFAKLHSKHTSVDHILTQVKHAFPDATKDVVYRILHVGARWIAIVQELADVAGLPPEHLIGVLCLFSSPSSWERAKEEDRRLALQDLCRETDLLQQVQRTTPAVTDVLGRLLGESSFVYESVSVHSRPIQLGLVWTSNFCWGRVKLFLLLSHLAVKEPVPPTMLLRGATSRKRWTQAGEINNAEATDVGLAPELVCFLSDATRLDDAFRELGRCQPGAVRLLENGLYCIDEAAARRLSDELSSALRTFWEGQALIVAYRAIPWKYLEPIDTDTLFVIPHLQHTLQGMSGGGAQLSTAARTDLALTLVEAARFPGMSWKRAALTQAEATAPAEEDRPVFLQMGISQNRCVLSRISGDVKGAIRFLDATVSAATASASSVAPNASTDVQTHAATGQTLIQRALNDIQTERLNAAEQNLEAWSPLDPQHPSPLDQTVLIRQAMIRGRLLRFRGRFSESQACLGGLVHPNQLPDAALVWDEELRDLTCDLVDSLRELGRLDEAEACLRVEITRRQGSTHSINHSGEDAADGPVRKHKTRKLESRERAFLDLALAEVRFARGALRDAYDICVRVLSGPRRRFCTLRGHIILAKVHHVWGDHRLASHHWTEALKAMSHFTLTNGYTTQVILESARENMRHLAQDDLAAQSDAQLAALRLSAVPGGGMQHWIAGMQQWSAERRSM